MTGAPSILGALFGVLLGLSALASGTKCPKQKQSPGREVLCYTSTGDLDHLTDAVCRCTTLVHQGHDVRNITSSDVKNLRKTLKDIYPALQVVISVVDPTGSLRTSATMRQDSSARLANILREVDGVELNVTAGSKERLFHFVKGLRDEMVRKSTDKRIFLALPTRSADIAKQFDLKELSKYVDLFTVSTDYLVDDDQVYHTFHPSRLIGLFDMLNTDSLVDLISGLGAPKRKILVSLPASGYKFTLINERENAPRSPTKERRPAVINRKQICDSMSTGEWTVERDEDLTAPYAFKDKTWIAFEDNISTGIKGKYVMVRDLAGLGVKDLDNDLQTECGKSLAHEVHHSFTNFKRKSREAVLSSLEDDLHQSQLAYSNHVKSSDFRIVRVVDTEGHIRAVRESTRTEFSCPRQGYFVHPKSCNRFYRCVKFNQGVENYSVFEFDCPAGLSFDERTEVCVWPHTLPEGSPCPGSSEIAPVTRMRFQCPDKAGYYADPQNGRWFFACIDLGQPQLMAYEFRCPYGLVFDQDRLVCEWPWNVEGYHASEYTKAQFEGVSYTGGGHSGPAGVAYGSTRANSAGGGGGGGTYIGTTASGYSGGTGGLHIDTTGSGYSGGTAATHISSTKSGYSGGAGGPHIGTTGSGYPGGSGGAGGTHISNTGSGYSGGAGGAHVATTAFGYSGSAGGTQISSTQFGYSRGAGGPHIGTTGFGNSGGAGGAGGTHISNTGSGYSDDAGGTQISSTEFGYSGGVAGSHRSSTGSGYSGGADGAHIGTTVSGYSGGASGAHIGGAHIGGAVTGYSNGAGGTDIGTTGSGYSGGARGAGGAGGTHISSTGSGYSGGAGGTQISSTEFGYSGGVAGSHRSSTGSGYSGGAGGAHIGTTASGYTGGAGGAHIGGTVSGYSSSAGGTDIGTTGFGYSGGASGAGGTHISNTGSGYSGGAGGAHIGTTGSVYSGGAGGTQSSGTEFGYSGGVGVTHSSSTGSGYSGAAGGAHIGITASGYSGGSGGTHSSSTGSGYSGGVGGAHIGGTVPGYSSGAGGTHISNTGSGYSGGAGGAHIGNTGSVYSGGAGGTQSSRTEFGYSGGVGVTHSSSTGSGYSGGAGGAHIGSTGSGYSNGGGSTDIGTTGSGYSGGTSGIYIDTTGAGYAGKVHEFNTGNTGPGFSEGIKFGTTASGHSIGAGAETSESDNVYKSGNREGYPVSSGSIYTSSSHPGTTASGYNGIHRTSNGSSGSNGFQVFTGSSGIGVSKSGYSTVSTQSGVGSEEASVPIYASSHPIGTDHPSAGTASGKSGRTGYGKVPPLNGQNGITVDNRGASLGYFPSSPSIGDASSKTVLSSGGIDTSGYLGGMVRTGGIVTGKSDSSSGTLIRTSSSGGTVLSGSADQGAIITGSGQPGYVETESGRAGYVVDGESKRTYTGSASPGAVVYGSASRGVTLHGASQPPLTLKGSVSPGILLSGQTAPGVTVSGGSTSYRGTIKMGSVPTTPAPSTGYQTNEYHDNGGRGTIRFNNGYVTSKYAENDLPDYRPSIGVIPEGRREGVTAVAGSSFTPSGFTKVGPTKTGYTTATLGGSGSYVISTGPKPTLNPDNIGEKAFSGNVGQSTGYTYPKPKIPFVTGVSPVSSGVFVEATATPILNVEVYNKPTTVRTSYKGSTISSVPIGFSKVPNSTVPPLSHTSGPLQSYKTTVPVTLTGQSFSYKDQVQTTYRGIGFEHDDIPVTTYRPASTLPGSRRPYGSMTSLSTYKQATVTAKSEVQYLPTSSTLSPAVGVTYHSSTARPTLVSGEGSPTNVGISRDEVEKLVTNYKGTSRGTVKYTPSGSSFGQYGTTTASVYGRTEGLSTAIRQYAGNTHPAVVTPSYEITSKSAAGDGKGKIIVKWSDLHPLLLGKLNAECTCKSDPFANIRGPGKKLIESNRGEVDLANYDESDVYVDLENEGSEYDSDYGINDRSTVRPLRIVSEEPSSTLRFPLIAGTLPDIGVNSNVAHSSGLRFGKSIDSGVSPANLLDRYGPGGYRDSDEVLEGVSDCARPGLFRHPNFCNKFYACHWDQWKKMFTLHVFNCPVHLTFDTGAGACNWPSKGPACQDNNLLV